MAETKFTHSFQRAVDRLGFIGRTLKELSGYRALAFELIQNADDTQTATTISFDVREDRLVVEDDGGFTDCGEQEECGPDECPWLEGRGHRCDFHSFRLISGADKRAREDTTGAFGIGFIAVYQITDLPEIYSGDWHWSLDETRGEDNIQGRRLRSTERPAGTKVVLPHVLDNSELRKKLGVPPVPPSIETDLRDVLAAAMPIAILFLRNLERVELRKRGRLWKSWERKIERDRVVVSEGGKRNEWRLLEGSFAPEAERLRASHGDRMPPKRDDVSVALPIGRTLENAVLCSTLPTEEATRLGVLINADFFPTSDRRALGMQDELQHEWNQSAIKQAGVLLADAIEELPEILGAEGTWELLERAWKLSTDSTSNRTTHALAQIWDELEPAIPEANIVPVHNGGLCQTDAAVLLRSADEEAAAQALTGLDLEVCVEGIRPQYNLLRHVGIREVDVTVLADALRDAGLDHVIATSDLPAPLDQASAREAIWTELSLLVRRIGPSAVEQARSELADVSALPTTSDTLAPTRELRRAKEPTRNLFEQLASDGTLAFLDEAALGSDGAGLGGLVPELSPDDAVDTLEATPDLQQRLAGKESACRDLLQWFASNAPEIDPELTTRIAELPIFPSGTGFHELSDVVLPGDFTDELGLTNVVDRKKVGEYSSFVQSLGAEVLTFEMYVRQKVPDAFATDALSIPRRRAVVRQLAEWEGKLMDIPGARDALRGVPLVECQDKSWRAPTEAYLPSKDVRNLLDDPPIAVLQGEARQATRELLTWLGVPTSPRAADVLARVRSICEKEATGNTRKKVGAIFEWLGEQFSYEPDQSRRNEYEELRTIEWLPVEGSSEWYSADSGIFTAFRKHLFESQARFLDVPRAIQTSSTDLMTWLGVRNEPTPDLVVDHLRHVVEAGTKPHTEILVYLNQHADSDEIDKLRDVPCLPLVDGPVKGSSAFWSPHPFGPWRYQLDKELRKYSDLLERLGVREVPEHSDALAVLREISSELRRDKIEPKDEAIVLACWGILAEALRLEEVDESSLHRSLSTLPVVPDARKVLMRPHFVFFEDVPGIAEHFGALNAHIIPRPEHAWTAMSAAGVGNLSDAEPELIEVDPLDEPWLGERIREREPLIRRILSSENLTYSDVGATLEGTKIRAASSLSIRWSIRTAGRTLNSEPASKRAALVHDTIWSVFSQGQPSWEALGQELARLVAPGSGGNVAMALAAGLRPGDGEAAAQALDDAGIPRLASSIDVGSRVTTHGFDEGELDSGGDGGPDPVEGEVDPGADGSLEEPEPDAEVEESEAPGADDTPTDEAGEDDSSAEETDEAANGEGSGVDGRPKKPPGRQEMLRSYVSHGTNADPDGRENPAAQTHREAVDQAAIEAVMAYERAQGRTPTEMDHSNRGYDIESVDSAGHTRFIEVKGTGADWDSLGVGVTAPQFESALERGFVFWLYVVENSLDGETAVIHAINDPGRRVVKFMFDGGWREAADDSCEVKSLGSPESRTSASTKGGI